MTRQARSFMAVSRGQVSAEEGAGFKKYIGVGSVNVLAVNPNKAKLSEIYGRDVENEPVYVKEVESGEDKHKVMQARIDFIVKTADTCVDAQGQPIELTSRVTFFLLNERRVSKNTGKIQVIDKYGRTQWVTEAQLNAHEIPNDKNGNPLNLDADYRPVFSGEEDLTGFLKAFLNIPNPDKYVNGKWIPIEDRTVAEVRLDKIADYFKGNFSELVEILSYQPNNKVKVLFGVRTADDNKQYQAAYTQMFLKNSITDYSKLDADVQSRKAAGAYPTTEFEAVPLHEYVTTPTDFGGEAPAAGTAMPAAFTPKNPFAKQQ